MAKECDISFGAIIYTKNIAGWVALNNLIAK